MACSMSTMCTNFDFEKVPNYKILMQVFDKPQPPDVPLATFIKDKRSLLTQMEPRLSEKEELDMLYGFFHYTIREKIKREEINTFKHLLKLVKQRDLAKDPPQEEQAEEVTRIGITTAIAGLRESLYIDSGTCANVASLALSQHLKRTGHRFDRAFVCFVDREGKTIVKNALLTNALIRLEYYEFKLSILVFDDTPPSQKTVLGNCFIGNVGLWMRKTKKGGARWGFEYQSKSGGFPGSDCSALLPESVLKIATVLAVEAEGESQ